MDSKKSTSFLCTVRAHKGNALTGVACSKALVPFIGKKVRVTVTVRKYV